MRASTQQTIPDRADDPAARIRENWRQIEAAIAAGAHPLEEDRELISTVTRYAVEEDTPADVAEAAASQIIAWWKDGTTDPGWVLRAAARSRNHATCVTLAEIEDPEVDRILVRNPATPNEHLCRIIRQMRAGWENIGDNPEADEETLRLLWAKMRNTGIDTKAGYILANHNCPYELAEEIWNHQITHNRFDGDLAWGGEIVRRRHPDRWAFAVSHNLAQLGTEIHVPTAYFAEYTDEQLRMLAELTEDGWAGSLEELEAVTQA